MVLDAEICRPVADFCIRLVNDFRWKDVLFVKNFCVLVQEFRDDSEPATDGSFHGEGVGSSALAVSPLCSSGMAVVAEEPLRLRGCDPVSAYPLHRFTYNASVRWRRGHHAGVLTGGRHLETLSSSQFGDVRFEFLVLYVLYCAFILSAPDEVLNTRLQIVVQLDIHDLTPKISPTKGIERAWVIEQTLARVAATGHEQLNIRPKFKGVRRRPARNHAKPWMAEVRNPKTKNKIFIGDFSTRQAAALAADVGAVYYGTGKDVLNFQHTPRFLPRTLEYSSVKEKVEAVRKEARLLRESTLFYLIHQLPYEVVSLEILTSSRIQRRFKLEALVIQLMRLVRKDEATRITFGLPAPGDIPQLLQSIKRLIENNPSQEDVDDAIGTYSHFVHCFLSCLPPTRGDDIPLTLHFIGWVERNYMRAPETSSWKSFSSPRVYPLRISRVLRMCRNMPRSVFAMDHHHQMPLEIAGCHGRLTTIFPSPIPTAVEVSLFPLPMSNRQNCNCGFQTGSVELNEDPQIHNNLAPIQGNSMLRLTSEDLMHGSIETMKWAPVSMGSNWQLTCMSGMSSRLPRPFTSFSPLSIPTQTQAIYMDLDDGEDQTMSCPSWIVVGDVPSECNTMAVPCPCPGEQAPDTLEYDKRHPHETPVESDHAATMLLSSQLAEFMDSNEGEDFTTLLETEKCDQRGYIRDHIFQLEEMLRHDPEVCDLDIDDTVLIAITGPKEANETNSWHILESLTEPPQPFVFSSQPFVQFDEYL